MELYVHGFETAEGLRTHTCHGPGHCQMLAGAVSKDFSGPYSSPEEIIDATNDMQASLSHDPETCEFCQQAGAQ